MQILNNNKQFSTLSDFSTAVIRYNLKIRVEKKQNRAINLDQELETVLLLQLMLTPMCPLSFGAKWLHRVASKKILYSKYEKGGRPG